MNCKAVLLLSLAALAIAVPVPIQDGSSCSTECSPAYNKKFAYLPKKSYQYNYESTISLKHEGVSEETPSLKQTLGVEFHVQSPCEVVLKITNAKLYKSTASLIQQHKKFLEDKVLVFGFHDGHIREVCPDPKDPVWVVNIKKGILSTFQNTMDNLLETHVREVDVTGQCDTHYTIKEKGAKTIVIQKTKDLASCTDRLGNNSRIQADSYISFSKVQSLPITKSHHECKQTIKDGIITEAICEETHILEVFNKGDKGTTSRTYTKLVYSKTVNTAAKSPKKLFRGDLLYDHTDDHNEAGDVPGTAFVLREICDKTKDDVSSSVPALFTKLVYKVRKLSFAEISSILKNLDGASICSTTKAKDSLLSALAMAGTDAAVRVMVQILAAGNVTPLREKLWYTTFAIIRDPSPATIEATIPLIDSANPKRIAVLGVSSLAHTYCREHPDCEKEKAIQKLLDKLAEHIKTCKTTTDAEEDKVVTILKAFGNIGRGGKHKEELFSCAEGYEVAATVKIAAIESFRRFPCDNTIAPRFFNSILRDNQQDSEIRIDAYLAAARCPTSDAVESLTNFLEREHNNQVGNFIWSHINNLKDSELPSKAAWRKIANNINLQNKFQNNPYKYSHNHEWSRYSDAYNVGAGVDVNMIYSSQSFVPRSITANVTVELFGRSIALFEADLRLVHFDTLLERLFGPEGIYTSRNPEELREYRRDKYYNIGKKIEESTTRSKRELFPLSKPSQRGPIASDRALDRPEASLSFKVFGNEIRWYNFHNFHEIRDEGTYNIDDILIKMAKHKEVDILRNALFLDTSFTIPTITGTPLLFKLNGTATFGLKLKSHFDIRRMLIAPRSADIDTFIQPSIVAELSSAFLIDAGPLTTGFKKVSNVHSSTAVHAKVDLKEGETLAIDFDLPKQEQEIFHYTGDLFYVSGGSQQPLKLISNNQYDFNVCSKPIFGLEICNKLQFPKPLINPDRPWIFVSGHIENQILIRKKDPGLKGYQWRAVWKREKDASGSIQKSHILFSYDTPGTADKHEYKFEFLLDRPEKHVKIELRSPSHSGKIDGSITAVGNTKKAQLVLTIDDVEKYNIQGDIKVDNKGNKIVYTPTLKSNTGTITGTITREPGKKIIFDVSLPDNPDRFKIKGYLQKDSDRSLFAPGESSADLEVNLPFAKGHLVGTRSYKAGATGEDFVLDLKLDHEVKAFGWAKHTSTYKRKYHGGYIPGGLNVRLFSQFTSTRIPNYNYKYNFEYTREKEHIGYTFDANYGANLDDATHRVFLNEDVVFSRPYPGKFDLEITTNYIFPPSEINWNATTKTHYASRALTHETKILSGGVSKLDVNLNFKEIPSKLSPSYEGDLAVRYPGREVIVTYEREEYATDKIKGQTHVQWEAGKFADIVAKYTIKNSPNLIHREADIQVTVYNNPEPIRKYTLLVHKEPGKLDFKAAVTKPEDTYFAELHYDVSADRSNINGVAQIKFPTITGKLELKKQPTQTTGALDYKSPRRHITGTYKSKGPYENRQVDAELKWDADKDPSQKLAIQATIKRPKGKRAADIKGTITGPTRTLKGTIGYELPQEVFNGKHVLNADIEYAPRKKVTVNAEVFVDKSVAGTRTSRGKIRFNSPSFQDIRFNYNTSFEDDGLYRKLHVEGLVEGANIKSKSFDFNYKRGQGAISAVLQGGLDAEKFEYGFNARKPVFSQDNVAFGGGFTVTSPTYGVDYAAIIDYNRLFTFDEVALDVHNHLRWAEGKEVGVDVEYLRNVKRYSEPHHYDFNMKGKIEVITPNEIYRHQDISFASKIQHDKKDNQIVHEVDTDFFVNWGESKKASLEHHLSHSDDFISHKIQVKGPASSKPIFEWNREVKVFDKGNKKNIKSDTSVTWLREGAYKTMNWNTEVTYDAQFDGEFKFDIKIKTPFEKVPTARVTVENKKKGDGYAAKSQIEWANSGALQIDGQFNLGKDKRSFDVTFVFNSKSLQVSGWKLGVSRKIVSPSQRKYGLAIDFGDQGKYDFEVSATDKANNAGKKIDGGVQIAGQSFLTFNIDSTTTTKDENTERVIVIKITSTALDLSVETHRIWGPRKDLASIQACPHEDRCFKLEYFKETKAAHKSYLSEDLEWHLLASAKGLEDTEYSRTGGIFIHRKSEPSLETASFKIATWEEKEKYIGYHYEHKSAHDSVSNRYTRDLKIKLPSRTVEYHGSVKILDNGDRYASADILLDGKREPNRKLTLSVSSTHDRSTSTETNKVAVKHPDLKHELSIVSNVKYVVNNEKDAYSAIGHTELSLSQDPRNKIIFDTERIHEPYYSGRNFSFVINIRQLNWLKLDSRITIQSGCASEAHHLLTGYRWKSGNEYKSIEFEVGADRVIRELLLQLRTPWRKLELDGHWHALDSNPRGIGGVQAEFSLSKDGKVVRRASFDGSLQPQINLKYYANPDDRNRLFRIHGGLESPTTFHVTAGRLRNGVEVQDAEFTANLNSSRLLYINAEWRPTLFQEIHEGLVPRVKYLSDKLEEMGNHLSEEFGKSIDEKSLALDTVLHKELGPVIQNSLDRVKNLRAELREDLLKRDVEGVRVIVEGLLGDFADADDVMRKLSAARDAGRAFIQDRIERICAFLSNFDDRLAELFARLGERLANLPSRIIHLYLTAQDGLINFAAHVKQWVDVVKEKIEEIKQGGGLLGGIVERLREFSRRVSERISEYIEKYGELSLWERLKVRLETYAANHPEAAEFIRGVVSSIDSFCQNIRDIIAGVRAKLQKLREYILQEYTDAYDNVLKNPQLKELFEEIRNFRLKLQQKYHDYKEKHGNFFQRKVKEYRERLAHYWGEYDVYDFKNGHFVTYVPLPRRISSLREIRKAFRFEGFADDEDIRYIRGHMFKRWLKKQDHLPPYDGHALLIADEHFVTFDGKFYEFANPCSYLLTKDFVDGNFSAVVNYKAHEGHIARKSITIYSDGHVIEIGANQKVELDRQEVELPNKIETTTIERKWDRVIVSNSKGFAVTYDFGHNFVLFDINGFYFGKTAGLLGTYNNEADDDFSDPRGYQLYSVDSFTSTWQAGEQCSSSSHYHRHGDVHSSSKTHDTCTEYLEEGSELSRCFKSVNPEPYLNLCLHQHPDSEHSKDERACNTIAAYVEMCQHHYIDVKLPEHCGKSHHH